MRKISNFIINKRYYILVLFILLAIISGIVSKDVKINYDMAKYLPSTSETRIGMDIMEKEFSNTKTTPLNIMFKGLKNEEKQDIYNYLTELEGVDEVQHDNTENYNKDDYTLYVISVKGEYDSEIATNIYNDVTNKYKDYEIYTSGDITDKNTPVLETWIIGLAILSALIILIIMSESYVEPFLFMFTILIAVLLNKGTDIIFSSVSHITQSISAILPLSMDYSIMLMSRYNQEKKVEKDKIKAMKNALYNAFQSISSSSITTVVGLIVLVFMSFTIGRDLGLVLAKGVIFSLISIFFVLPGLILMFDKWIIKTKKKRFNIKLDTMGKISYKLRYFAIPLFLIVFIGSFLSKETLGILYTNSELDKISQVFAENNQMAIIYNNKDEEKIAKILGELNGEKIDEVLGYSNTINEKLAYNELNEKLKELGSDVEIEDYLLKILYYEYYNENVENTMTFNEFVKFIKNNIYTNDKFNNQIDETTKQNIDKLENFITVDLMNKKRVINEIAQILEVDEEQLKDIMILYSSKKSDLKISMNDFINFINKDVLTDNKYSSKIEKANIESLKELSKFTNKTTIQTKMDSAQIANLFGIGKNIADDLYKYYISLNDINTKITLNQFSNFVINNVVNNENYASSFTKDKRDSIQQLATFSNKNTIQTQMNITQIANLFGIDENLVSKVMLLKYGRSDNGTRITITEFVNTVKYLKSSTNYLDGFDTTNLEKIDLSVLEKGNKYTATELAGILGINPNQMYQIYALIDLTQNKTNNWKITPYDFVKLILQNQTQTEIEQSILAKLNLLSGIMDSCLNNITYSYTELANFIGIETETVRNIYVLYNSSNANLKMTPQEFVNFVLNHKNDQTLSEKLTQNIKSKLSIVQTVMQDVLNNKKYTSTEISNLLGINAEKIKLLYGLYDTKYVTQNRTISLKEIIEFILNDVIPNPEYASNFDNTKILKLNTVNGIMKASVNGTKYTANEIMGILSVFTDNVDENTIDLIYTYYGSENSYNKEWKLTVEEFVKFLNNKILKDEKFNDFIIDEVRSNIIDSNTTVQEAKDMLVGDEYSRVVLNTKFALESKETFDFIQKVKDLLKENAIDGYIIGDSPMAYEMSKTFNNELNYITVLTMIAIFIVVAVTFKSILIPSILVATIQCAVYMTMGILSFSGQNVYFISILIVQSILMGATIDYAILYTSYYLEHRKVYDIKQSIIASYNKSIHTILTSSSILIIVTLIVAKFATAIASKICKTISEGTICSTILILTLLPAILDTCDRFIVKNKSKKK